MFIPDLINRLWNAKVLDSLTPNPNAPAKSQPINPTQPVQALLAKVESQLADGSFKVLVNGKSLQVNLPAGTRAGDIVELTRDILQGQGRTLSNTPTSSNLTADISKTAQLITNLLQQKPGTTTLDSTQASAPLLPKATTDIAQIANSLRQIFELSGLFYESHQAQWVNGKRDLAQLLHEPQGQLSTLHKSGTTPENQKPQPAPNLPTLTSLPNTEEGAVPSQSTNLLSSLSSQANETAIDPRTVSLVQQQLAHLENHQFIWNGMIWPGQLMEWSISEKPEQDNPSQETLSWHTQLRLSFPHLGEVTAKINLTSSGIKIDIVAANNETKEILENAQGSLVEAMANSGITVTGIKTHVL